MHNLIADPAQLAVLYSVLDEYCTKHLVVQASDRDECARQLLALFSSGVTCRKALLERMDRTLAREQRSGRQDALV